LLAKAGVDINSKNNNGETALSLAKKRSLAKIIKKLKDVGAKD
jgi:ankyrin repeat protein